MNLSPFDIIIRLILGIIIGFAIGLTGIGGGVLVIPSLNLILGLPPSITVGTSSLYAFLTKIYAVIEHARLKNIAWKHCIIFLAAAIPGCILSAIFVSSRAAESQEFNWYLGIFIIAVISFSLVLMILNMSKQEDKKEVNKEEPVPKAEYTAQANPPSPSLTGWRLAAAITASIFIGAVLGATGVGGGVLVIPTLIMLFGLSTNKTVGSSILIAIVLCLATALIFWIGGGTGKSQTDLPTAVIMAVGSLAGVRMGSKLSVKLPEKTLKSIVLALIAIALISLGIKSYQSADTVFTPETSDQESVESE